MAVVLEGLGAAVDAAVAQDLGVLSVAELQEQVAVLASVRSRLAGWDAAVLAELDRRTGGLLPTGEGKPRPLAGWAADASGDTPSAAGRRIRLGAALTSGLPAVGAAVLDGRVGWQQATVLTRLVGRIDPAGLAEAEPDLIVAAQAMNPEQLAAWVAHQLATWVEPVLDAQDAGAQDRRYLKTRRNADGSLWGSFLLPAGDSETVLTTLEPLARKQGSDDARSAAQRRADALTEVCEQVLRHGQLPDAGGLRPQLSYVLPADWAARQADELSCPACARCPQHRRESFADLIAAGVPSTGSSRAGSQGAGSRGAGAGSEGGAGGGASGGSEGGAGGGAIGADGGAGTTDRVDRPVLPAEHRCAVAAWTGPQTRARIETMLCDARITRVLLDSRGQVHGLESLTDSVTPTQRRALAARDRGCTVRGCTRPPAMCDAHHLTARADGGPTTLGNMVLLCRRHHVLWHLGKISLHHLHAPWVTDSDSTGPPQPPPPRQPAEDAAALFGYVLRDG
jgi:hypothetical protein